VGRADHSSWPFRPEVGPFTFTLLIYPVLVLVLLTHRHWVRVVGLGLVSLFTLLAHSLIEPPQQIYGTWANNLSTPAPLYSVDPEHLHNLLDVESPMLGVLATILSIVLTVLLLVADTTVPVFPSFRYSIDVLLPLELLGYSLPIADYSAVLAPGLPRNSPRSVSLGAISP
jgi:hypothetical protein